MNLQIRDELLKWSRMPHAKDLDRILGEQLHAPMAELIKEFTEAREEFTVRVAKAVRTLNEQVSRRN